jgi:hypothetical protein
MTYSRPELEVIGEAFSAVALLDWSRRILAAAYGDLDRLESRGITSEHLRKIEAARMDVDRLRDLRKLDRQPESPLARRRRLAMEEAVDWRRVLRGLAQAVFDSRPDVLERFRPGIKTSRSIPQTSSELRTLLAAAKEYADALDAVGMTEEFRIRGRDILERLEESQRRLEEERSGTPQSALELNYAKGVLYTRTRYVCRVARVEFRNEPGKSQVYGYGPLRRRASSLRTA